MPIRITIDHFNRVVIGVGDGVLTIPDLVAYGLEVLQAKVVHYGKIIDVAGSEPDFTKAELSAFAQVLRETRADAPRGPLALVVDPKRGELAKIFVGLEMGGRQAEVFRSIHDARRWIAAQMKEHARNDQG
ncbi:hypothetical protein [Reyranella sp.]|uniref:hypothetical protein n=1 Tax=Reyranella sp. TaxID=1929291 RepID=UPI003D0D27C2